MKIKAICNGRMVTMNSRDVKYKFGDYVMYCPVCKDGEPTAESTWEIGRVTEDMGAAARVCYHEGCTAALTQKDFLRPATEAEIEANKLNLGLHRFDNVCPQFAEYIDLCIYCRELQGANHG